MDTDTDADTDTGIYSDPRFDEAAGDYSLDLPTSPCVDAGHPDAAYNDPDGTRDDMGAYGGTYGGW